jgi:TRAP-type C4-dicarboxylate transport system permease small subunit
MAFFLKNLDDWLASLFMAAIVLITILAVTMRYVLNRPLQWVEELTVALLIWAIMLGAASAMKMRLHISIDAFTSLLPERAQRRIRVFNDLLAAAVLVVFGILGLQLALNAGNKIMPILGLRYAYIDFAVPVGAFWMAVYLLLDLFKSRSGSGTESQPPENGKDA